MISATFLDRMGTDLMVVNCARVSLAKKSLEMCEADERLIAFLAREGHVLPFAHPQVQMHLKAPLFVARQMWKSHIGAVGGDAGYAQWNEVSRRYVDEKPEFYIPEGWRGRAPSVKQGSTEEIVMTEAEIDLKGYCSDIAAQYQTMLERGIAPEMARMILPQNMVVEWIWTGSLLFFSRVVGLRDEKTAQKESQILAQQISAIMEGIFPISWKALRGEQE